MQIEIFILVLAGGIAGLFYWAFRELPKEKWQILACVPLKKSPAGVWEGINLTYYGFFNAWACLLSAVIFLIMMGSLNMAMISVISIVALLLVICLPAARLIAGLVENKKNTFSVGGASFAGILVAPWIIMLANQTWSTIWDGQLPILETMTAIFIAYAFGEGVGRLACISFGCCYGKPLHRSHPSVEKLFRHWNFVFYGGTKKIAYAHSLEGQAVLPIQAITAVINTGIGLFSLYIFLEGFAGLALLVSLITTQGWRFASEFLRADYRGAGRISAYQGMTVFAVIYTIMFSAFVAQRKSEMPDLSAGLNSLWDPGVILFLAVLWLVTFFYTGRSKVTKSSIIINLADKNCL